jgi:hypothetical protein
MCGIACGIRACCLKYNKNPNSVDPVKINVELTASEYMMAKPTNERLHPNILEKLELEDAEHSDFNGDTSSTKVVKETKAAQQEAL